MNLHQRPIFRTLNRRRAIVGALSTVINLSIFYLVLCISYTPDLDAKWGMMLSWELWTGEGWWKILLVMLWVMTSSLRESKKHTQGDHVHQLYPKRAQGEAASLDLTRPTDGIDELDLITEDELVETTLDLARRMGVKVSGIFVGETPVPNAFTTFTIDHGNIVFLNSNLLEIMDRDCVESVIAHELGHIKEKDVLYKLGNSLPMQMARLWVILILIQQVGVTLISIGRGHFLSRLFVIVIGVLAFSALTKLTSYYSRWYSRLKEKMADAHAAEFTSIEGMMNGLLRLNDRSHTLETFVTSMRAEGGSVSAEVMKTALRRFPSGTKDPELIREHAPRYLAQAQLEVLLQKLSSELPEDRKTAIVDEILAHRVGSEESTEERSESSASDSAKRPFVWQEFDWNHDGELQLDELAALVDALKSEPQALTDEEDDESTHPPIRERILFIAALYQDELDAARSAGA